MMMMLLVSSLPLNRYGHTSVVEYLINSGATVNSTNSYGSTALHYAAGTGHVDVVRLLLKHGAQKDAKDKEKQTPLMLVKSLKPENYDELVKLLSTS
jgi:ankyrin repeat protein